MKSLKIQFNTMVVAVLMMALSGCVKQRERIDSQTANIKESFRVANVHGKTCSLTTKETIQEVKASEALAVEVDEKAVVAQSDGTNAPIRFLNIVNYVTDCPHLSDPGIMKTIEFRGETNTTYPMVFEVSENYVTVYKLATQDQISHLEMPYSKLAHNYWYVPVGGWPASFYKAELARNADNRETNQRIRVSVHNEDYNQATHVDMDPAKFQKFKEVAKVDVLPREFFDGEWYFAETVVNTKYQSGHIVGGVHGRFDSAPRIKFLVEKGNIFGLDVNIDELLTSADNHLNFQAAIKIPAELQSYRRQRSGKGFGLEETVHSTKKLEEANFVSLNFLKVETISTLATGLIGQLWSQMQTITVMKDLKIDDGFLSFTIEDSRGQAETRYTFLRTDTARKYDRRQVHLDDLKKFGYFIAEKSQIFDHRTERFEDIEERASVSRFNPDRDIVFHFSNITPGGADDPERAENQWVREVGREAISLWQQAFKMAGLKNNIRLDESKDVALGDIRYNILNLVGENVGSVIGYGPSLAEPWTGEVISATSNTFLSGIREGAVYYIRDYIAKQTKRYYDFTRPDKLESTVDRDKEILSRLSLALNNHLVEPVLDSHGNSTGRYQAKSLPRYTAAKGKEIANIPMVTDEEINGLEIPDPTKPGRTLVINGGFHEMYELYNTIPQRDRNFLFGRFLNNNELSRPNRAYLSGYVENHCPEVMNYIRQVNSSGARASTEAENAVILPCSRTFEALAALSTTVHEIGHNLGLRHNFIGSADKDNFLAHQNFTFNYMDIPDDLVVTNSSSIMDYVPSASGIQVTPGGYDVAALRFGYNSSVELKGGEQPGMGETVVVPNESSLNEFLQASSTINVRDYQFCTDEDAYYLMNNVFCTLHDVGTTAVDIATHWINNFYDGIERRSYRYDKVSTSIISGTELQTIIFLKRIYEQWRVHVSQYMNRKAGGEYGQYLDNVTTQQYASIVQEMLQDEKMGETYKDFLAARNLIFHFYLDIATLPNRYCITRHEKLGLKLYELEAVRVSLQERGSKASVKDCSHPEVTQYFADRDVRLLDEVGHFLHRGIYSLNPNDLANRDDFGGILLTRMFAFLFMMDRSPLSRTNAINNYVPGFMDEPDARAVAELALRNRIINGVNWNKEPFDTAKYAVPKLLSPMDYLETRKFQGQDASKLVGTKNFDAEAPLLIRMYNDMIPGLRNPSTDPTAESRITPYRTNKIATVRLQEILGNPSTAKNVTEYLLYASDEAIYTGPHNTFTTSMIKLYKQLSSTLRADETDVAIFPVIKDTVIKMGLYSPENKVVFGDILNILLTLEPALRQLEQAGVPADILQEFSDVYQPENAVFAYVAKNLLPDYGITTQEQFTSFLQYYIAQQNAGGPAAPGLLPNAATPDAPVAQFQQLGLLGPQPRALRPYYMEALRGLGVTNWLGVVSEHSVGLVGTNADYDRAIAMDLTQLYADNNLTLPSKTGVEQRIDGRAQRIELQQLDNQYNRHETLAQMNLLSTLLFYGTEF